MLTEKEVFLKRCQSSFPDSDHSELIATFSELLELMNQEQES